MIEPIASPYLHMLFKAVLIYEAESIKKILKLKIGGKLLTDWELADTIEERVGGKAWKEQEISPRQADVIWILQHPKREDLGTRIIVHEIKTGSFSILEEFTRYRSSRYKCRNDTRYTRAGTTNSPIFLWVWQKNFEELPKEAKQGSFKQLQLEWLLPILKFKIKAIRDFL